MWEGQEGLREMTQGRLWEGQAVTEHLTGFTSGAGDAGVTLIFVFPWVPQEGEGKSQSDDCQPKQWQGCGGSLCLWELWAKVIGLREMD